MVRSSALRKVMWGAMITALVVGSALLLMLTSQGLNPHSAQAAPQQPAPPKTQITQDNSVIAEFRTLNEAASTIELPDQPQPVSIALERKADNNLELASWHQLARDNLASAKKNVSLVYIDSSGQPTMRLLLRNAYPSEYRLKQKGSELVEEVTLTADSFQRVSP